MCHLIKRFFVNRSEVQSQCIVRRVYVTNINHLNTIQHIVLPHHCYLCQVTNKCDIWLLLSAYHLLTFERKTLFPPIFFLFRFLCHTTHTLYTHSHPKKNKDLLHYVIFLTRLIIFKNWFRNHLNNSYIKFWRWAFNKHYKYYQT